MRSIFYSAYFALCVLAAICALPFVGSSQSFSLPIPDRPGKEWLRITTAQDSTTDVGVSTLVLEPNGLFRATFRISLSKSEDAAEKPGAKYKVRLLTLEFDPTKPAYRIFETTLLDSSDKVVYASGPISSGTWRPFVRTSQTYNTYYSTALNLPPLGLWKITSSSNSQPSSSGDGPSSVAATMDRFQIGRITSCSRPSYESAPMTRDDLAKLTGLSKNAFQLSDEKVNVVKIRCDSANITSETHILILKSVDRAILLSGGDVYALEK